MGASSSSTSSSVPTAATSPTAPSACSPSPKPRKITPLYHPIILEGMPGSGRSTLQCALDLSSHRVLSVPHSFLTTPPIYTQSAYPTAHTYAELYAPNTPTLYSSPSSSSSSTTSTTPVSPLHRPPAHDHSMWYYGGREFDLDSRWSQIAQVTNAIVFTIDATKRDTLIPKQEWRPLPRDFIMNYRGKTETEQAEILATLTEQMTAKSALQHLLYASTSTGFMLRFLPLLIVVTHCDQPNAMSIQEIHDALNLSALKQRHWKIVGVDLIRGDGLQECVDWLNYTISQPLRVGGGLRGYETFLQDNGLYTREEYEKWMRHPCDVTKDEEMKRQNERDARVIVGSVKETNDTSISDSTSATVILPPPMLFKTNGDMWKPTEEQRKEFVVAPVSQYINGPSILDQNKEKDDDGESNVLLASSTSHDDFSSVASTPSTSSSPASSIKSSHQQQTTVVTRTTSPTPHTFQSSPDKLPDFIPEPPTKSIKKHWYSREKRVPIALPQDIHAEHWETYEREAARESLKFY